MKIVTGYTGTPHISSNDDQARNQGIFGRGGCVLDVGNQLNATLTNATTVTLSDGDGIIQGVHFRIEPGMTEAVSISPGTTGYNRIDLICARYTKDASTGVEDVSLVVIEGTPSSSTASEPSYTEGDILNGDTLAELPIWKVALAGLTPTLSRIVYPIHMEQKALLWSNPNPQSYFSGTISVDLSEYQYVDIVCHNLNTTQQSSFVEVFNVSRHKIGASSFINRFDSDGNYMQLYSRGVAVQNTGITFSEGQGYAIGNGSSVGSIDRASLVPILVYGVV